MNEKIGGYISKLKMGNKEIDLEEDSIVVFVGANNVGKSQALKDIYNLSEKDCPSTVIDNIELTKYEGNVEDILKKVGIKEYDSYGSFEYKVPRSFSFDSSYKSPLKFFRPINNYNESYHSKDKHREYRNIFVNNLKTEIRLSITNPAVNVNKSELKTHPIQFLEDNKIREIISDNFYKAFDSNLFPYNRGKDTTLCFGENINFDDDSFNSETERHYAYEKTLASYPQIQDQGDGMRSFVGILLFLTLDYINTFLIDEPESFLHPPQAKIMGKILGSNSKAQLFIATHSEDIIKGLLETSQDRVKIIRISRESNTNYFSILDNDKINQLWIDPLLKYSNILSSLFHDSVVLCESDSDCTMYSIIDNYLKEKQNKISSVLFIHCGGKDRMSTVASSLRALNVPLKIIVDFDVLNDVEKLKKITNSFNIDWNTIEKDYDIMDKNIKDDTKNQSIEEIKRNINNILDSAKGTILSKSEKERIEQCYKKKSKWEKTKQSGKSALPAGDATQSYNKIENILHQNGIFIVPVGELECFIKSCGNHGPKWVNNVLREYPDLNDEVYDELKKFILEMNI